MQRPPGPVHLGMMRLGAGIAVLGVLSHWHVQTARAPGNPGGLFGVVADGMGFLVSMLVTAEIAVVVAHGFSFGDA